MRWIGCLAEIRVESIGQKDADGKECIRDTGIHMFIDRHSCSRWWVVSGRGMLCGLYTHECTQASPEIVSVL